MSRRAKARKLMARRHLENLVDLRDALAEARNFAAASYMACQALGHSGNERPALCAVTNLVRERLELTLDRVDRLIAILK